MKIRIDWRGVGRTYLKFLTYYLPIGLVPLGLVVGFSWYDFGWQHVWGRLPSMWDLLAFKLLFYGGVAAVVLWSSLFMILLAPTSRRGVRLRAVPAIGKSPQRRPARFVIPSR